MEGDFLRPLIATLIVGSLIMGTGATLLFFALRAAREPDGGERRFVTISAVLVAFVFICCVLFFVWSIVN